MQSVTRPETNNMLAASSSGVVVTIKQKARWSLVMCESDGETGVVVIWWGYLEVICSPNDPFHFSVMSLKFLLQIFIFRFSDYNPSFCPWCNDTAVVCNVTTHDYITNYCREYGICAHVFEKKKKKWI